MKNFINLADIDKRDLRKIIDHAKSQKKKRFDLEKSAVDPETPLADKICRKKVPKPETSCTQASSTGPATCYPHCSTQPKAGRTSSPCRKTKCAGIL